MPAQPTEAALERAVLRRVHFVYERATRRFKGTLRFWSSWLDFCTATQSSRRFSKACHLALLCSRVSLPLDAAALNRAAQGQTSSRTRPRHSACMRPCLQIIVGVCVCLCGGAQLC